MAKLKVCAAFAAVTLVLGAGGFAYKAAAQSARPAKAADVRPEGGARGRELTELELLRKEVDILKLQVEVLQDKVRALRPAPQAGMGMPGLPMMGGRPGMAGAAGVGAPGMPGLPVLAGGLNRLGPGPGGKTGAMKGGPAAGAPDAVSQVEAAVKALRQAREPEERRRATEALEKAVKKLRGEPIMTGGSEKPTQP